MDNELKQYLDEMRRDSRGDLVALEQRVNDRIERVETALLTEFHKWASPAMARSRTHNSAIQTLDLEVEALKDRVAELEKKKAS
jgi:polyhydroxyalkanoate synthesis regulator phasin